MAEWRLTLVQVICTQSYKNLEKTEDNLERIEEDNRISISWTALGGSVGSAAIE